MSKRYVNIALALLLTLGIAGAASAAPSPKPPAAPPPASKSTPLDSIIEEAKKEGAISLWIDFEYAIEPFLQRLKKEISASYGVNLDIKCTATQSGAKTATQVIAEKKAGKASDYDLISIALTTFPAIMQESAFTQVDWKPLLIKGTDPQALLEYKNAGFPVIRAQAEGGYFYNPTKVPADKKPKTASDFADPMWKGKVGIFNFPGPVARFVQATAEQVGSLEKAKDVLRAILNNGAFIGDTGAVANRYLLGELWMGITQVHAVTWAQDKGVPAEYQLLGPLTINETFVFLPPGLKHPNAAKLVALYLASPAGAKLCWEVGRTGNYLYPGNSTYDAVQQAKKEGRRIKYAARDKDEIEMMDSPEFLKLQKESLQILQGGQKR